MFSSRGATGFNLMHPLDAFYSQTCIEQCKWDANFYAVTLKVIADHRFAAM